MLADWDILLPLLCGCCLTDCLNGKRKKMFRWLAYWLVGLLACWLSFPAGLLACSLACWLPRWLSGLLRVWLAHWLGLGWLAWLAGPLALRFVVLGPLAVRFVVLGPLALRLVVVGPLALRFVLLGPRLACGGTVWAGWTGLAGLAGLGWLLCAGLR